MTAAALQFRDLTLGYDRHPAVHHLNGAVEQGALPAVVGPNGAGKSTLFKGIVGAIKPLAGSIDFASLAAHDIAVAAVAGWIEAHAHTRFRIAGEVAVVDAEGMVAAGFRQHTSRTADPQLHTHVVIANRVRSPDGRWLALDARTIKLDQRTLSALYHAGLRAELTARLGVGWDVPVHGIAELAAIPEVLRVEFSQRTGALQRRVDEKLDRFAESMGREPTVRERWRLEREAVLDSRPARWGACQR